MSYPLWKINDIKQGLMFFCKYMNLGYGRNYNFMFLLKNVVISGNEWIFMYKRYICGECWLRLISKLIKMLHSIIFVQMWCSKLWNKITCVLTTTICQPYTQCISIQFLYFIENALVRTFHNFTHTRVRACIYIYSKYISKICLKSV